MITFDIYRGTTLLATVHPDDNSQHTIALMGEDVLKMNFALADPIAFQVGDYVIYHGATYQLNEVPYSKVTSTRNVQYQCEFQGLSYELAKVGYKLFDFSTLANIPPTGSFSLMGDATMFMSLLVNNMNRRQSGWSIGTVIATDMRLLTFKDQNCMQVLQTLVSTFSDKYQVEFYVTPDKKIHLTPLAPGLPTLNLQYGQGGGLVSLTRNKSSNSSSLVTRMYGYGSTRNIPPTYRGGVGRLILPGDGSMTLNTDLYGDVEGDYTNENIYPRLNAGNDPMKPGTVTAVVDTYNFTDAHLDFDVNLQLLPSMTPKVKFITGNLAGYEFAINTYNNATKTFTINQQTDDPTIILPTDLLHAGVGDQYVILDINMPQSYIDKAESELAAAVSVQLNITANPANSFQAEGDAVYFKQNNLELVLGQDVYLTSAAHNVARHIRVTGWQRTLNKPSQYKIIQLSDYVVRTLLATLSNQVNTTTQISSDAEFKAYYSNYSANQANWLLRDLANDNKLTASEKIATNTQWQVILNEKAMNDAQADSFGVDRTAYDAAYTALSNYVTPLLADMTTTSNIVGADFTTKFSNYFTARTALLNAIATKAKALADAAQNSANTGIANAATAQAAANAAATAASNAQTSANTGIANAATANNLLADIANDNKLTPSEKTATQKEWNIIVSEVTKNDSQADVFGVSRTTYDNAYSALNTYITPLLSSLTTTSDITGTTFRSNFKAYYDARTDLLNAIATKAKSLADAAQNAANTGIANAATAQAAANAANASITQISSDSYLTPYEKLQLNQIWIGITAEHNSLTTLATAFLVDKSAYETAYQSLSTYITSLNLTNGAGQAIVKTDFNTAFGNYFNARAAIESAIATAQKSLQGVTINGTTFLQNGLVNASLIDVSNLFAKHIYTAATGARLTLNEVVNSSDTNELRVYDANGNLMIRLGVDADGLPKLMFFNSSGAKIYELSQNGIVTINGVPASFTSYPMYKLTSTDLNNTSEVEVATLTQNTTIYAYNAGNDVNTTNNKQYEAYKWTTNTMNSSEAPTGSHIPDGLYTTSGNAPYKIYNAGLQTEYKVYSRTVSQYSNGQVVNSKTDSWTVYTYS